MTWWGQKSINTEQLFLFPIRAEFLDRTEAGEEEQLRVSFFRMVIFACNMSQQSAEGEDTSNRCAGWSQGRGEGARRTARGTPVLPQTQIKTGGGEG